MDYFEFKDRVGMGEEFQFYFNNVSYWISKNSNGFYLTRESDEFCQEFKTADELFMKGIIEMKRIEEIFHLLNL